MSSRKDDDITTNLVAPSPHCRPLVPFNAILLGHMLCTGVPVLWRHSGDRWRCQLCVSPMFLGAVTFLFLVEQSPADAAVDHDEIGQQLLRAA